MQPPPRRRSARSSQRGAAAYPACDRHTASPPSRAAPQQLRRVALVLEQRRQPTLLTRHMQCQTKRTAHRALQAVRSGTLDACQTRPRSDQRAPIQGILRHVGGLQERGRRFKSALPCASPAATGLLSGRLAPARCMLLKPCNSACGQTGSESISYVTKRFDTRTQSAYQSACLCSAWTLLMLCATALLQV